MTTRSALSPVSLASRSETATATEWVREFGLGLPVMTAIVVTMRPSCRLRVCRATVWVGANGVTVCGASLGGAGLAPEAAAFEDGQHALAEPVGLLQVRVAGEDELGDADARVLLDQVRDLLVAADQGRAGAAADQADAGPEVRVDLEVAEVAAVAAVVQRAHPLLAF